MSFAVILLILCELLLLLGSFYLIWSWLRKTPFYPSSARNLQELVNSGKVRLPPEINFIDVGSGDGRIVNIAADFSKSAEGIEFNPFLSLISRFLLFVRGKRNTMIHNKDFNNHDFSNYNFVYLYIFGEHMDAIRTKLIKELTPGSVMVTNTFKFKDLEPDLKDDRYYIYYIK